MMRSYNLNARVGPVDHRSSHLTQGPSLTLGLCKMICD